MKKLLFAFLTAGMFVFSSCADECKDVTCENGGACNEGVCECAEGYEGDACETSWASLFVGNYNTAQQWTVVGTATENYTFSNSISAGNSAKEIIISNFSDSGVNLTASLESNSSIKITNQNLTLDNTTFTVNGTGTRTGSTVTLTYTLAVGGTITVNATDVLTK